ncbi:CDP-glycerol glycerophosphotransferase family protein, partial [Campylobacter coli]|nr:CDP-glycerol glycerophosphotransferase family protein [Campylobacter coli]
ISFKEDKVSFQRYFQNSDLMITDYTSAAFEMAYIGKPVIYYQFDKNYFFSNHSYKVGWFDYNRDGFGPVVYSMDELFKELQAILDNKCIMEEKYYKNILDTFLYRDCNNCARVFKAINRIREDISNSAEKISSLKERGKKMQLRKEWNFAYNIWIYLIKNYNLRDQDVIYSVLLCLKQIDEKKDILLL